jgi:hypothetical protein
MDYFLYTDAFISYSFNIPKHHFFYSLRWGETEITWYVGHYLTYCTSSGWWRMMSMQQSVGWTAGEFEALGENLPQCHFVHYPNELTWGQTRTTKVGSRRPTDWAMARKSTIPWKWNAYRRSALRSRSHHYMEHKWSVSPSPGDYNLGKEPQIPTGQDIELEPEVSICNNAPKIACAGSSVLSLESPASSINLSTR